MKALNSSSKNCAQGNASDDPGSEIADGTVESPPKLSHEEIMKEFLVPVGGHGEISPMTDESGIGFRDDKQPIGRGVQEMLEITKLLNEADIPCCMVGEAALIYYGAGRLMDVRLSKHYHHSLC